MVHEASVFFSVHEKICIFWRHLRINTSDEPLIKLKREYDVRYKEIFETENDTDNRRRAAETKAKRQKSANDMLARARDETDPGVRSAMMQTAAAKRREADAKFRKAISEAEFDIDDLPPFPTPGNRSMTSDEMWALQMRLNLSMQPFVMV